MPQGSIQALSQEQPRVGADHLLEQAASTVNLRRRTPEELLWPDDRLAQLIDLWINQPELTTEKIGARLGVTKNAVIGKLDRLRKEVMLPARPVVETIITPDYRLAQLIDLWINYPDLTTEKIGVRLGVTKNAVIGKLNRLRKEVMLPARLGSTMVVETIITREEAQHVAAVSGTDSVETGESNSSTVETEDFDSGNHASSSTVDLDEPSVQGDDVAGNTQTAIEEEARDAEPSTTNAADKEETQEAEQTPAPESVSQPAPSPPAQLRPQVIEPEFPRGIDEFIDPVSYTPRRADPPLPKPPLPGRVRDGMIDCQYTDPYARRNVPGRLSFAKYAEFGRQNLLDWQKLGRTKPPDLPSVEEAEEMAKMR